MAIHSKLSTIMGDRRIKQAELARITGISPTTINTLYNDKVQQVDYTVLDRICKALKCDVSDIIIFVEE